MLWGRNGPNAKDDPKPTSIPMTFNIPFRCVNSSALFFRPAAYPAFGSQHGVHYGQRTP